MCKAATCGVKPANRFLHRLVDVLGTAGFFAGVNPLDIHIPSLEGPHEAGSGITNQIPCSKRESLDHEH